MDVEGGSQRFALNPNALERASHGSGRLPGMKGGAAPATPRDSCSERR